MINKLVIENLKHRPVRTLLSVLAIGVEVTMMLTLVGVSEGTLEDSARRAQGVGAEIWVRAPNSSLIGLSQAVIPQGMLGFFLKQPHVVADTGTVVQPMGAMRMITGLDLESFTRVSGGFKYLAGGPFKQPHDVIVDEFYAQQNKLTVGSTLYLLNQPYPWRVCGIVEPGKLARIVIPLDVMQDLTSSRGKLSQIFIKLDNPAHTDQVIAALKKKLPEYPIYSVPALTSMYSVSNIPELSAFIDVVIGLSIVVGFLVVFLSMYTAVLERTREIGILKALGASPAYVLNIIIRETLLLATLGAVLGILLTYGSRMAIAALVPASLTQKIVPGWWPIAGAIAVTGALLGASYPAWKAARQDVIEALAYE